MGEFEHEQDYQYGKKSYKKQHWNNDQLYFKHKHFCKKERGEKNIRKVPEHTYK